MSTIQDVAKRAQVSTATVSRVINQSAFVSSALTMKVRRAMDELDFRPNGIARSLRRKQSDLVALVIPDISNPFFTALVRGVEEVVNRYGFDLILCNTDETEEKEQVHAGLLCEKHVAGVIMAPAGHSRISLEMFARHHIPVVLVDRQPSGAEVDAVLLDNAAGAYTGTSHLLRLGHRRIGLVAGKSDLSTTWERVEGYQKALVDAGLTPDPELLVYANSRIDGGCAAARALMNLPAPPTAVFIANNLLTIGVIQYLKECGIHIPQEVAVVGFDDFESTSIIEPPLTVVAQPTGDIGRTAAALLVKRVWRKAGQGAPRILRLNPRLVVRQSCGGGETAANQSGCPQINVGGGQDDEKGNRVGSASDAGRGPERERRGR